MSVIRIEQDFTALLNPDSEPTVTQVRTDAAAVPALVDSPPMTVPPPLPMPQSIDVLSPTAMPVNVSSPVQAVPALTLVQSALVEAPSPAARPDVDSGLAQVQAAKEAFAAQMEASSKTVASSASLNEGLPFQVIPVDLSLLSSAGVSLNFAVSGVELYFRREGSTPGARLVLLVGGEFKTIYPGCRVVGPFEGFGVAQDTYGATAGLAQLVVVKRKEFTFFEPHDLPVPALPNPVDLLGSYNRGSGAYTFVAVAENTQPSGATPTGSFLTQGFSLLRVLVDGQAANTLESVDLVPWFLQPGSSGNVWFEQGSEMVSLPDSIATAYRYRVFTFPVYGGPWRLFFEVRNLLPAGQTRLGFMVQGLR